MYLSLQVLHYLQNVNFTTRQGERVYFDKNGDPPSRYEMINLQGVTSERLHVASIGVFDATLPSEHQFIMNGMNIVWGGGRNTVHIHFALFSYLWVAGHNAVLRSIS